MQAVFAERAVRVLGIRATLSLVTVRSWCRVLLSLLFVTTGQHSQQGAEVKSPLMSNAVLKPTISSNLRSCASRCDKLSHSARDANPCKQPKANLTQKALKLGQVMAPNAQRKLHFSKCHSCKRATSQYGPLPAHTIDHSSRSVEEERQNLEVTNATILASLDTGRSWKSYASVTRTSSSWPEWMLGENMLWQHKRFYVGEHGCCWEPYAPVARMLPNVIILSSLNARRKRMLLYGGHCTDAPGLAVQGDGGGFCTVWHLPGTSTPSHVMTTDVKSTKSRTKKLVYLITRIVHNTRIIRSSSSSSCGSRGRSISTGASRSRGRSIGSSSSVGSGGGRRRSNL